MSYGVLWWQYAIKVSSRVTIIAPMSHVYVTHTIHLWHVHMKVHSIMRLEWTLPVNHNSSKLEAGQIPTILHLCLDVDVSGLTENDDKRHFDGFYLGSRYNSGSGTSSRHVVLDGLACWISCTSSRTWHMVIITITIMTAEIQRFTSLLCTVVCWRLFGLISINSFHSLVCLISRTLITVFV